jgi:flavin reductase (DIM6/NTAB) family NADH-FMN oxidoreductase RutF
MPDSASPIAADLPATRVITPSVLYFGTPVVLLSTVDAQGHANLTPLSSAWALGDRVVLGLAGASQGCRNLLASGEAVINLPGPGQQAAVEALAPTTGRHPVPGYKQAMGYRFEADKFALAGLTAAPSQCVAPPRVADCPLQLEARLLAAHGASALDGAQGDPQFMSLELRVLRVHAHEAITLPGTQHVDTASWSPLLYVFRHYFGTGPRLGRNFRAET